MALPSRLLWATLLAAWVVSTSAQDLRTAGKKVAREPQPVPGTCQGIEARAEALRTKLDAEVPAQVRSAAQGYVAKPTAGSNAAKAWNDFSAHALLYGDARAATWAALNAVRLRRGGNTLTSAGVALSYHGDNTGALAFLNCAYALGHREANLLEALAVIHQEQGRGAEARGFIAAAREADSQDPLIEIAHSLITTGKPPPRIPRSTDALERCLAELGQHSRTVLGRIKDRAERFKAITGNDLMPFFQPLVTFHEQTLAHTRGLIPQARSMPDAASRTAMIDAGIMQCVFMYFHFTGNLLESYFGTTYSDYTALVFWADALGIDPAPYWREQRPTTVVNVYALALPSEPYIHKLWAEARECPQKRSAYQREAAHSRQRFQRAGMRFDEMALPLLNLAENEVVAAREFAVRMTRELKGSMTASHVQVINAGYRRDLLDNWLDGKVPELLNALGTAFQRQRQDNEESLQSRKQQLDQECPAIPPEVLEALLAEQWKAYRDGLWQALLGNFEMQWDARVNCEVSVNGFSGQVFDDGNYEAGYKGKVLQCKVGPGGAGSISAGPFSTTIKDGEFTSVSVEGRNWEVTADRGGVSEVSVTAGTVNANYPPFTGAGKLTISGRRDSSGRMEPKVGFSGKLGLGLKVKGVGAACYPGSGSVSVTPRKAMADAIKYALTDARR
jgi:hypothetical protein